jgi:hypothetical protein
MIKVIHKKDSDKHDNVIYVGRGSALGNPYTSIQDRQTQAEFVVDSRKESIQCFKDYLLKKIEEKDEEICVTMNEIYTMAIRGNVHLACYCKPKSCHGDVIKEIVESKINPQIDSEDNQLDLFSTD